MSKPARASISTALTVLCEDAFFAITSTRAADTDDLKAFAKRRLPVVAGLGPDVRGGLMDVWEGWLPTMAAAIAPIASPLWLPLADAVSAGLSLTHGARGVRSLFTSKPSEKDVMRVRTTGSLAVRVMATSLAASGSFNPEMKLLRAAAAAAIGLPEEDQKMLNDEAPQPADALDVYGDVEPKIARAVIKGAFQAAMSDGLDPREEEAVILLATKLGLSQELVHEARTMAKQAVESGKPFGEATVDGIRYVLSDDKALAERFGVAAARLVLAPVHRRDALTALNVGGPVVLGKKHQLDRKEREGALAAVWTAVLAGDPAYARRVELMLRHNRFAADLGSEGDAADARAIVERHVDAELLNVTGIQEGSVAG